jgi:hypothetical protein
MQVCWYHALSNEKEEMMGVLIGEKKGTGVHFSTLKAIKRMTKQKDRVEIDDSQLVAASTFAASLQATSLQYSSFIIKKINAKTRLQRSFRLHSAGLTFLYFRLTLLLAATEPGMRVRCSCPFLSVPAGPRSSQR